MAEMLTLGSLREHIPDVQSGDPLKRERGQMALLRAADKLLWKWSHVEFARARAQIYVASVEDVHGLLVLNFLKALDHVDLAKLNNSATNYLYHYAVSRLRRELNSSYGNVKFSNEFLEGARRAKAIETRLAGELGRAPTDEEIIEASSAATPGIHMGPVASAGRVTRKPLTQAFVRSWREHAHLLEIGEMPSDDALYGYVRPDEEDEERSQALRELFSRTAELGGMSCTATQVVFAAHGIHPHREPLAVEEVAKLLGLPVLHVQKIIRAWLETCRTPGGPFHRCLSELSDAEASRLGVAVIREELGSYEDLRRVPVPAELRPA